MGETALSEIDKAHELALRTMAKVENSTNGVVDHVQATVSDLNQKAMDTKNMAFDSFNSACEDIQINIRELGPELEEMGVRALNQAFSRIEELPDRFDEQLSNNRKIIQKRTTEQIHQIIEAANKKIGDARGLAEKRKDGSIGTLGEPVSVLTSDLGALIEGIKATFNDIITKIGEETTSAFSHEAESREASARIDFAFHELSNSAGTMIHEISSYLENGIKEMRDELENSINESFNEFVSLFEELSAKIDEAARGIIDRVDSVLNDINSQASGLIREMISGARKELNEAVEAIGENIDRMIDSAVAVTEELRDSFSNALDGLMEQIRKFTEDTLSEIKNSVNRILQTVTEEIERNIEAARESVEETVMEMARRMNREIEKIKNDLSLEAEKQARELRVMGEEAYAEAEENYVNAGYTEDTSVIPGLRSKGEEVTREIERSMEEQADRLILDFRSQADILIPRITLQGEKLTARAAGAGTGVIGECAGIGMDIAASITGKGKQLTDDLENTMEGMSRAVKERGDEYLSACRANMMEAAERTAASTVELCGEHVERAAGLVNEIRMRFEDLMKEAEAEYDRYTNDYPDSIMTAMDDLGPGYLDMFDNIKGTSKKLISETEEKMRMFVDEMKSNTSLEIKRTIDGIDSVENVIGKIENDIIPQIEGKLESLMNEYQAEFSKTLDITDRCEPITSSRAGNLAELRGMIEDGTKDMANSMEQLFVSLENDTRADRDVVLQELESGTEKILSGSSLKDTVEGLKNELEARTDELKGRKDEIDRISEKARENLKEAAGEVKKSSDKASETARKSVQDAMSEALAMSAAVKEAGSVMTEKLNEAVSVVKAAGETGKAGMKAVKAAGAAGGEKPGSDSGAVGQTGDDDTAGSQAGIDSSEEDQAEGRRNAGEQMEAGSDANEQMGAGSDADEEMGAGSSADEQMGAGSSADEQMDDGGTADGRREGDQKAVARTGDVGAASGRAGSDVAAEEQAVADAVPEEKGGTDIEGYDDDPSYEGSSPGGKIVEELPGEEDGTFPTGEGISDSARETISASEPSIDPSGAMDGRSVTDGIVTDDIPPEEADGEIIGSVLEDHPSAEHPDGGGIAKGGIPGSSSTEKGNGILEGQKGVDERELPRKDDEGENIRSTSGGMAGHTSDTKEADRNSSRIPKNDDDEKAGIEKAGRRKFIGDG